MSVPTAILVDNMYLQIAAKGYGIEQLDPRKYPKALLRTPPEEHFKTFIFDALPYAPDYNPTELQLASQEKKKGYLDAIQYYERIAVETGDVRPKRTTCPECGKEFTVPVQKLVDVKISVRLVSLAWSNVVKKIVLVAGDKDLLPAVEAIQGTGAIVRLAFFEEDFAMTSKALIRGSPEKQKLTKSDIAFCRWEKP